MRSINRGDLVQIGTIEGIVAAINRTKGEARIITEDGIDFGWCRLEDLQRVACAGYTEYIPPQIGDKVLTVTGHTALVTSINDTRHPDAPFRVTYPDIGHGSTWLAENEFKVTHRASYTEVSR